MAAKVNVLQSVSTTLVREDIIHPRTGMVTSMGHSSVVILIAS